MIGRSLIGSVASLLVLTASAQEPSPSQPAKSTAASPRWSDRFWTALGELGIVFKQIANLGSGGTSGQVWIATLATDEQRRIATPASMAWPVFGQDDHTVFALRDGEVVRLTIPGGEVRTVGTGRQWLKLVGVSSKGDVLGFVSSGAQVLPAILTPAGETRVLPAGQTDDEKNRVSILLQENRSYEDETALFVERSMRGGRGFDVTLVNRTGTRNVTDCGDDYCGQPSLSSDRRYMVYVRAP